ncbi:MAG: tRNA (adenosine(37)-N6)-threonylcarbamoyltransferase complex dimerization subunit type 1 TsaB, partial [Halioglobus sp.]
FTGLRIAASAVQGLAFSHRLPVVGVSTLAVLAQCAFEDGLVDGSECVLSLVDARVGDVYCGVYAIAAGIAVQQTAPWVTAPSDLSLPDQGLLHAIGDGLRYVDDFPRELLGSLLVSDGAVYIMPRARSVIALARAMYERGEYGAAADVQPVYVRDEISWKKLAEQGKQ